VNVGGKAKRVGEREGRQVTRWQRKEAAAKHEGRNLIEWVCG
jgi:hypothetical protein